MLLVRTLPALLELVRGGHCWVSCRGEGALGWGVVQLIKVLLTCNEAATVWDVADGRWISVFVSLELRQELIIICDQA